MGQYYNPIILDEQGDVENGMIAHEYGNGLKLMEHSWLDNEFVAAFETLLVQEAPVRMVWAGDYADAEVDAEGNPRTFVVWYRENGEPVTADVNLYQLVDGDPYRPDVPGLNSGAEWAGSVQANAYPHVIPTTDSHPYLLNWDKKALIFGFILYLC